MAEALKEFKEGEDILASEINDNYQFLLSKLSDNAAQVQQYVEGEVATIKSNVSSVQATLQNIIDEFKNSIKSYVIETWEEGKSGYRIFSDGYCEQWGVLESTSRNGQYTVNLKIKMADMNYQVLATNNARSTVDDNWDYGGIGAETITTSTIKLSRGRGSGAISWFVHGKKLQ